MADSDIIDRIRKLQARTVENGCTEDEADTAMRMAMGLMARHGIEQSMIPGDKPKAKMKRVSAAFKKHQLWLAGAAAEVYGCRVLIYNGGKGGLEFVGRPENIEATEMTMFWLMHQTDLLYKHALRPGLLQSQRAEFRRTFKEACAARILGRAKELVKQMETDNAAAQANTGSTALVVLGHFKQMAQENEEVIAGLKVGKARVRKVSVGSGTREGRAAGDQVKLRKEIG